MVAIGLLTDRCFFSGSALVSLSKEGKSPTLGNKEAFPLGPTAFLGSLLLIPPIYLSIYPWKRGFSGPTGKENACPIFGNVPSCFFPWGHQRVFYEIQETNELRYLLLLGGKSDNARSGWPSAIDWGTWDDLPFVLFFWSWVSKPVCLLFSTIHTFPLLISCATFRIYKVVLSQEGTGGKKKIYAILPWPEVPHLLKMYSLPIKISIFSANLHSITIWK